MSKFTKGPWLMGEEGRGGTFIDAPPSSTGFDDYLQMCLVSNDDHHHCKANARLIVKAPDLYTILEDLLPWFDQASLDDCEVDMELRKEREKAIDQARDLLRIIDGTKEEGEEKQKYYEVTVCRNLMSTESAHIQVMAKDKNDAVNKAFDKASDRDFEGWAGSEGFDEGNYYLPTEDVEQDVREINEDGTDKEGK
ncbi:MAG: hypothetical protein ACWGQW_09050 [bacterium]